MPKSGVLERASSSVVDVRRLHPHQRRSTGGSTRLSSSSSIARRRSMRDLGGSVAEDVGERGAHRPVRIRLEARQHDHETLGVDRARPRGAPRRASPASVGHRSWTIGSAAGALAACRAPSTASSRRFGSRRRRRSAARRAARRRPRSPICAERADRRRPRPRRRPRACSSIGSSSRRRRGVLRCAPRPRAANARV